MLISKFITKFTQLNKWLAFISLTIMMFLVAICAIARGLGKPIVGDVELVQLSMVAIIVGALSYTEHEKAHISIGLVVDNFPKKVQYFFDLISAILTAIFAFLVAYVFIIKLDFVQSSTLLKVPFFYFKVLLIIGFAAWGLECMKNIYENVRNILIKN
jgi:TRAP-type C4-dicarboxylate transport system permease small subunit